MTDGKMYVGVNGVTKRIKNMYAGVDGAVVSVPEMWAGVEGVSRQIFAEIPELEITTSSLPRGTFSSEYNAQINAVGGTGGYSFFIQRGYLPKGLTLSEDGVLSGIPEQAGMFGSIYFGVRDSEGNEAVKKIIVRISHITVNFTVRNERPMYTGKPITATVTPNNPAITSEDYVVTYAGEASQINVGTYEIKVTGINLLAKGYQIGTVSPSYLAIMPNTSSAIIIYSATVVYDGLPHGLIPTVSPSEIQNDYRVTYTGKGSTVYEESEQEPVEIGTYTVKAETTNTNYTKRTYTATLTITEG